MWQVTQKGHSVLRPQVVPIPEAAECLKFAKIDSMTLTLLDGGLGQELMARSTGRPTGLWSVQVQIDSPDLVQKVHHDYFLADGATVDVLEKRSNLGPTAYADFVEGWVRQGVAIVGGCCEVGPAHIHELARRLKKPIPSNPF